MNTCRQENDNCPVSNNNNINNLTRTKRDFVKPVLLFLQNKLIIRGHGASRMMVAYINNNSHNSHSYLRFPQITRATNPL